MTSPVTGTCSECGAAVPWRCSTLDRHAPGTGESPSRGEAKCPGSYRPPTEAAPSRPMTAAERRLSREMFP